MFGIEWYYLVIALIIVVPALWIFEPLVIKQTKQDIIIWYLKRSANKITKKMNEKFEYDLIYIKLKSDQTPLEVEEYAWDGPGGYLEYWRRNKEGNNLYYRAPLENLEWICEKSENKEKLPF